MSSARTTHATPELVRPTLRSALPFIAVAALGMGVVFLPPYSESGGEPTWMIGAFLLALIFLSVSIRRPARTWLDPVAPLIFFVVVALARDLTGGASSGLGPLVALPILWLSMVGTRRDLWVAALFTAATFLVPIFTIGPPDYPVADWRRAFFWVAFAVLIAPAVQRVVQQLAVETQSQRRARAELDGILEGARLSSMITTAVDGTITTFGVGARELLGYSSDEVVGHHDPGLFHDPDEVQRVAEELAVDAGFAVFRELARRAEPSRIWTYIRKDSSRLFVRLAVTELRNREGEVVGYLGVAIDATNAVEAERALARSEGRWRVLADHLPEVTLIVVGEDLRIQLVTGAGAMRQGFKDARGKHLEEVSKPANVIVMKELLAEAFAGREVTGELAATLTGAEHEVVVTPLPPDADGRQALILGRDVSRDRARERQVVQAKERAERLFADAPQGIAILTTAGIVKQINNAMRAIIGPTHEPIEGRPLSALASPGDDRLDRHLTEALSNPHERAEMEWTVIHESGDDVHVVLSSRVLTEPGDADDIILVNVVDVSERHRFEQRLAHLADHDALTGLLNRRRFDVELTRHLEHGYRYGPQGAILVLDLDHFKDVNDTLGHGAGDELIVATAALLQNGLRATDLVARLGGDEFAILLGDTDLSGAQVVARSIVDRVRDHAATLDGNRRHVTVSVGVVEIEPDSGQAADLLALADLTMYDAKEAGRNQFAVFDKRVHRRPRTAIWLEWKSRLEQAIETDAFVLHLQPILDLESGRIRSAEALLRLDDAEELVRPGEFIQIAERAGLIWALDAWVIEHSIELLARLRAHEPDFSLEVNLSGLSIGDPHVEEVIHQSLRKHAVDPRALILEITETAAVADVETARQFAERMTALGCQFALDDFGAGFGSFYYLKHLLFDYVKIDGEFVANCHRSDVDRTILRSIVRIAHDLGKKTVAEYVASPEILQVVRDEGVDFAQGYLIGRPTPLEEFALTLPPTEVTI